VADDRGGAKREGVMERVITALSDPDSWTKPQSGGMVGLVIGAAIGVGLGLYWFPARKYSYATGKLLSVLVWMPCALLGIIIGQLVAQWMGR
jgi:hypothetical protein